MKTKKQLLAAMERMYACREAVAWVEEQRGGPVSIGRRCPHPEWLIWFLWRTLTPQGRALFATRLGDRLGYDSYDIRHGTRPGAAFCPVAHELPRRVIDDCWRAWCRS